MTPADLRSLLRDSLLLWDVDATTAIDGTGVAIQATDGTYHVAPASPDLRPARWFLQTPDRATANRPPRAMPSIVALLSALRNALGAARGARLRVGAG
ncbi:MAG: hypothetical protein BGO51_09075 [Rhodospirillales bacterium 69-11]|nr:hypothetical protein [Rhodospirillales bacterium]MBN8925875.1 hypothetical protein [Rhodospirillales bacterium]OJW26234.1 MAG: hypothetical protein BGO51_09075 [Rhodospirillales bacterium 69-11]